MPLYLYRCRRCGHNFELLRRIGDADSHLECPECGTKEPQKVITPFYGNGAGGGKGGAFRFG